MLWAGCIPVHWIEKRIGRLLSHNSKVNRIALGVTFIMLGSFLSEVDWGIPHFVSDALSWLIHGFGAAPIINAVLEN